MIRTLNRWYRFGRENPEYKPPGGTSSDPHT